MSQGKTEPKFSVALFSFTVVASLGAYLFILKLVAPDIWEAQMQASISSIVLTTLAVLFVNCFIEYIFHRYVLHAPLFPFLAYFYKQHTIHHALTGVVAMRGDDSGVVVKNRYPIINESQYRASFFPWYSFLIFSALLSPFFFLAQRSMPQRPIFLGGCLALTVSISLYEIVHAIEHLPLERWSPFLHNPKFGGFWRLIYSFHLRHHADVKCNEAVSGFLGLPLADWVFGTWVNPRTLYPECELVPVASFKSPKPRFIGWLDQLAERAIKKKRER